MDVISGEHHWKQRLIQLINHHQIDIDRMGFPADWQARPIWQQNKDNSLGSITTTISYPLKELLQQRFVPHLPPLLGQGGREDKPKSKFRGF